MGNSKQFANVKSKKYHFTYQTKCLVNNKTYIGRHSTNDLNDGYIGSGKLLKRAIKKHGKNNFVMIPLDWFDSYKEVVEEEKFLVTKEWCQSKTNYNLIEGAENPIMYGEMNPAWKGGISKTPNYRITGAYDYRGKNNPRYGYKYSEEEKLSMLKAQKTRVCFMADGVFYNSLREYCRIQKKSKDFVKRRLYSDKFKNFFITEKK